MFGRIFRKTTPGPAVEKKIFIAQLNARLQPLHRGELFEDPLQAMLLSQGIGEVSGGGTLQARDGEIEYCDIEISVPSASDAVAADIIQALEKFGAPKGSKLHFEGTDRKVDFGRLEGMAVYLNGTALPAKVYRECDSNFVYAEFGRLLGDLGRVLSYWQGPTETALYMYGASFEEMKAGITGFTATYPLCQRCRIVQVA